MLGFDPVSLGIQAVGLGLQLYSGFEQAEISKEVAQSQNIIAQQEGAINAAKQRQMELEARRMQTENIRNIQRGRAMAAQAAVNQGAQFGTGLQGGLAQVQQQGFWNMLGVDQALYTGREIAGYNQEISSQKARIASLGGDSAELQGYSSLGGALMKAGPTIGQLSQSFGTSKRSSHDSGFSFDIT